METLANIKRARLGNVRRHVHVIRSLWFLPTPSATSGRQGRVEG